MENRKRLIVDFRISEANGRAERAVALQMVEESIPSKRSITLGSDRSQHRFCERFLSLNGNL